MVSVTATPPDAQLRRLPSLTGLRWVAALLVFAFHAGTMGIMTEPLLRQVTDRLFSLGLSGVQFFFILSGFVLVWSAKPGERKRDFWQRRVAKIFPNHVLLWAVVLLLGLYWGNVFDLRVALANLFLVQAWIPVGGWFYSVNNVSWSLSCELFFYLCLPLALPTIKRMPTWLLTAVLVAVPLLIVGLWPAQQLLPEEMRWWFTQIFPVVRSLEFWMGVAAAELSLRGRWRGPGLGVASALFVVTWLAASFWIRAELWAALMAAVYVVVIAAAARSDVRGTWSPWRGRTMVRLGEISFAYYLLHVFVIATALRLLGVSGFAGWWGPVAVLGFLLLNLALAELLFRYVETPMMRRLRPRRRGPGGRPDTPRQRSGPPPPVNAEAGAAHSGRPMITP